MRGGENTDTLTGYVSNSAAEFLRNTVSIQWLLIDHMFNQTPFRDSNGTRILKFTAR